MLYKKILLPLDGSDLAAQALPYAEEIAGTSGAELVLFEVIENPLRFLATQPGAGATGIGGGLGIATATVVGVTLDDDSHRHEVDQATEILARMAESLRHRKVAATTDIDIGEPAARIVDYAAANKVDLIVMSSHGRTGLSRWAYGSVANKVLHAAPCPVLVVRNAQPHP